jgi:hypothetical protein
LTSKRRYQRVRPKSEVTVQFETGVGIQTFAVENISMGGLFMRATEEDDFPVGSRLSFVLMKPGLKRGLPLEAIVAFERKLGGSQPAGVGLRFEELSSGAREKLQQILQESGLNSPDAPDSGEAPAFSDWGDAVGIGTPAKAPSRSTPSKGVSLSTPVKAPAPPEDYGREPPTEPNIKLARKLAAASAPGKTTLFDDSKAPPPDEGSKPVPFSSAHAGYRPAPKPKSVEELQGPIALPAPATTPLAPLPVPELGTGQDAQERLMVQIRGLLLQLGETQEQLAAREEEIRTLKEEVKRLTEELQKADPERRK